jgi:predicted amidohydrolase YtcJ
MNPTRTMLDRGRGRRRLGPVTPLDPMTTLRACRHHDPSQRLDRGLAIRCVIAGPRGSAIRGEEGTLTPGMHADFASRPIHPRRELDDLRPVLTRLPRREVFAG